LETEDNRPVIPTSDKWKPWLRWMARSLDYILASFIGGVIIGTVVGFYHGAYDKEIPLLEQGSPVRTLAYTLIGYLVWTLIESATTIGDGGTPGKKLLGIRIRRAGGGLMDSRTALKRAFMVWWNGVATGLPLATHVMQFVEFRRFKKTGRTSWDERLGLEVVFERKPLWRLVVTMVLLGVMILGDIALWIHTLPQNRAWQQDILASLDLDNVSSPANSQYNRGVVLYRENKLEEAAAAYEKALEIDDSHLLALNNLGVVYSDLGRNVEALECYEQGLSIDPEHELIMVNVGTPLRLLGRYEDAVAAMQKAHERYPNNAQALFSLGLTYTMMERHESALDAYKQATELNPDESLHWYFLGCTYEDMDDRTKAFEAYQEASRLNPDDPDCYVDMGRLQMSTALFSLAAKNFEKAIELDPGQEQARYFLAGCYEVYSRRDDLLEQYCVLVEMNSDYAPKLKEMSEITDEEIDEYRERRPAGN